MLSKEKVMNAGRFAGLGLVIASASACTSGGSGAEPASHGRGRRPS
jgi:hypothetical protein